MRTIKQQELVNFLEGLVHKRYSINLLNKILSEKFNEQINITNLTKELESIGEEDISADYNFVFDSKKDDTRGCYDIFILPTREDKMYITEVAYEFN